MNHDEFVGQVQHRAQLASRGAAETVIRVTFETLGERLLRNAADHLAAQLPPELARHLSSAPAFSHVSLDEFYKHIADREGCDQAKASFHAKCVMATVAEAISPGALRKLQLQLPIEFSDLFALSTMSVAAR